MRARIGTLVAFAVVGVAIAVIAFGWIEGSMRQSSSTPPAATSSDAAGTHVTLIQYDAIANGMTLEQVEHVMGFTGHVTEQSDQGGITTAVYSWTDSRTHAAVIVTFMNSAVTGKAVFGL